MSVLQKLKEEEREVRKQLIMDAAIKLLDSKLFHEINMRDIADEAGFSVSSIYKHFQNQEDLFLEILIRSVAEIVKSLEADLSGVNLSLEELAVLMIDYCIENEAFFKISCNFMIRRWSDPDLMNRYIDLQTYFRDLMHKIITGVGIEDKDQQFTRLFLASIFGIFLMAHNDPELSKPEKKDSMHALVRMLTGNIDLLYSNRSKPG